MTIFVEAGNQSKVFVARDKPNPWSPGLKNLNSRYCIEVFVNKIADFKITLINLKKMFVSVPLQVLVPRHTRHFHTQYCDKHITII